MIHMSVSALRRFILGAKIEDFRTTFDMDPNKNQEKKLHFTLVLDDGVRCYCDLLTGKADFEVPNYDNRIIKEIGAFARWGENFWRIDFEDDSFLEIPVKDFFLL
jgi:hypothetical protein